MPGRGGGPGHRRSRARAREPLRVVEFGPGWGNLTGDLVATGLDVTAVELDEKFCQLIAHRCDGPGRVTVVQGDMLGFAADEPFDAAVFFESFHHCADHLAMLRRLHDIVRPGGAVLFAVRADPEAGLPVGPAARRALGLVEPDPRLARAGFRQRLLRPRPRPHRLVGPAPRLGPAPARPT